MAIMKFWSSGIFLLLVITGYGQTDGNMYNLENGVALKGYDPVCYFTLNRAVKGKKEISFRFQGISYYFASSSDLENFRANPLKYEPQYGGWCAYAMGHNGTKVEVDPETFKIINGRLFLFYNRFFNNTLKSWNQDEASLHTKADANWQKLIHP
jgi:YHS domain-containing protein